MICRMCLSIIDGEVYHSLNTKYESEKHSTLKERCKLCFPDMNFDVVNNAVVCVPCRAQIDSIYEYKIKCLKTEAVITDYLQRSMFSKDKVDILEIINSVTNTTQPELNFSNSDLTEETQLPIEHDSYLFYQCELCTYTTVHKKHLVKHSKIHKPVVKLECDKCDFKSHDEKYLEYHKKKGKCGITYKCARCLYTTTSKDLLRRHCQRHEIVKTFQCDVCNKKFGLARNLEIHQKVHSNVKPYACSECSYKTAYANCYKLHMQKHKGEKPYKCDLCDYATRLRPAWQAHMNKHADIKAHKCDQCDRSYVHLPSLINHRKQHSGVKPFVCEVCNKTFVANYELQRHIPTHGRLKCPICKYSAKTDKFMNKHMILCHPTSNKCVVCTFETNDRVKLREHMKDVHEAKLFECDACEFVAAKYDMLVEHCGSVHPNWVPYVCSRCMKTFPSKGTYADHQLVHENNRLLIVKNE